MAFASDHSGNFPREFALCAGCGMKGVYKRVSSAGTLGVRCKYCRREKWIEAGWLGLVREADLIHVTPAEEATKYA